MAQPLEDANPTSRCPPCTAMSTLPPSFGLSAAFTGQRLPLPPPLSLPLPPPPPGGCPPHPMLMLQWMRSLFSQQPPLSQPSTSSPLVSAQPSLQSLHGTSETAQMVGLLSSAKNGAAPPHGSAQSIAPHSPPPIQALNPFVHESMEWHHNNQEADQLRRFHQALCSGSLDPQTMKMYQNFRYSLKVSNHSTPRRKNTTRETTGLLKAWLNEHRKNPYPNKSEKIMLAVITKMSLTQVSTWFANARRRLKKENKATWSLALEQHFPDMDEGFSGPTNGEVNGENRQYISSPLLTHSHEDVELGMKVEEETREKHPRISREKSNNKIWSVVEMTEEG